jgi:hypothetical protein
MAQRLNTNCARLKGAPTKLRMEDCALSMGQSANYVAMKDVQINLSKEEYA